MPNCFLRIRVIVPKQILLLRKESDRWRMYFISNWRSSPTRFKALLKREMQLAGFSVAREELEVSWRRKVEEARERYQTASAGYRALLQESPEGQIARSDSPLALARRGETKALMEYMSELQNFTELCIDRKIPRRESIEVQISADGK